MPRMPHKVCDDNGNDKMDNMIQKSKINCFKSSYDASNTKSKNKFNHGRLDQRSHGRRKHCVDWVNRELRKRVS